LSANPPEDGTERHLKGSRATHFMHLINESVPAHLAAATCIYFDGIAADYCIPEMLDLIEGWFATYESKPRVVLVGTDEKRVPRYTVKSLRIGAATDEAALRRSFNTLQFFPKGRTTIDDTWRPSVYFAVKTRRPASAFFCVNVDLEATDLVPILLRGDEVFRSCAAYGFWFPERFSPLGYFWGISVEPAGRQNGAWDTQKGRRLSHWRDNTDIGIVSDSERRFFGSCDGYVRDAYPLMLVDQRHMRRNAGCNTLAEQVKKHRLGEIEAVGGKRLWRVPPEKLAAAQKLLDDNDITLSGRRLEGVRYQN